MHVVLISDKPSLSGIGRYAYSLYMALRKLLGQNQVTMKTLHDNNRIFSPITLRIFNYLTFMTKIPRSYSIFHITNHMIGAYTRLMRPNIITVHDLMPFIFAVHKQYSTKPIDFVNLLMRLSIKSASNANKVICVSENTKKDLLYFLDADPEKVRIIHYGVNHELFKPRDKLEARKKLELPLDKPIVLNVGSEEPRKNIPVLLKSFKVLVNDVSDALLVRVGERTASMESLITTLGLQSKVIYRKALPNEVALYYNAADLLAYPSYYEGFGNPPLEAMSSGLPVIAGNRTSIPEVVGGAGILLDPFDVNGFAYWMRELLTNEDLRAKLSEAGYKRSLIFSWEKCARETLEVYKEVLNEA